jgi:6-pyruvoyltetrahydropterin/6-carboxytetrahydropterin synthase
MFRLTVRGEFCAAHAIVIRGERESVHGHNWRVTVTFEGPSLDADGLLMDFHEIERALAEVIRPWHNRDLNQTPPFDRMNPTAEQVARTIAEGVGRLVNVRIPDEIRIREVEVTEAPGCTAVYAPDPGSGSR